MATVLFENVALFDGVSSELREPTFVLVEGNRIREVSDQPIRQSGAERIDGQRQDPDAQAMIDCHVHVYVHSVRLGAADRPPTYYAHYAATFLRDILACGFTTVRDVAGGDHGLAMALEKGWIDGPRFFYGGRALSQTGGHGDFRGPGMPAHEYCMCGAERNELAILADGVDACIKAVREELRKGAHHIKIMGSGGIMKPERPDRSLPSTPMPRSSPSLTSAVAAARTSPRTAIPTRRCCVRSGSACARSSTPR